MASQNFAPVQFDQTMEQAFPDVDPGIAPFGSRVLVQIRMVQSKSKGGIALVKDTQDAVTWNTQVGIVRAMGPLAFHNRQTMEKWPEGAWCDLGDYVRVPKYGGDKWERKIPGAGSEDEVALFLLLNDLDLLGKVTCDPREIIAFV